METIPAILIVAGGMAGYINSPAKLLRSLMPHVLRQMLLRARLRCRGRRVDFGPGAWIDFASDFDVDASLNLGAAVLASRVGRCTYFGDYSLAISSDIGAFCSIAPHAIIGGGKHPTRGYVTTSPRFYSAVRNPWGAFPESMHRNEELPRTYIGNDVWIGYSAVVLPGVRVADGAIIGAGAVVTRDVEPYGIAVGVPANVVRSRFNPKEVDWLLALKWWNWPDARLKGMRPNFRSIESLRAAIELAEPVETLRA